MSPWLLLLLILPTAFTGQVTPSDLQPNYVNQGLASVFKLYFTLDNPLPAMQYARIIWPYDLGFTSTWTSAGSWGPVSAQAADPDITIPAQIRRSQLSADSSIFVYYVQFTSGSAGTFATLNANQPYLLIIKAINTPSTTGVLGPIQFYTVSSAGGPTDTNFIIYDSNPTYSYLFITAAAANTLTANFTSAASTRLDLSAYNYPIVIDIVPTTAIATSFRFAIETTNPVFTIVPNTCINLANTGVSATLIASGIIANYTSNRVLIAANEPLVAGRRYRFQCGLSNPNYVATGGITVKTMWLNSPQVIENATATGSLSTQAWSWGNLANPTANLNAYLGWGIDFTTTTNLPTCFKIYKGYDNTRYIYNTIKFGFKPSQQTPTAVGLIVNLNTMNSTNFKIVPSSLAENLPHAHGEKVSCSVAAYNVITCINVGPLDDSLQYFISFKFYILSTASETTVGSQFGQLTITDTVGNILISVNQTTIADNNIYTNGNIFYPNIGTTGNAAFRADNLAHSFLTANAVPTSNGSLYGMYSPSPSTASMDLIFEQYWAYSDVTSSSSANPGDGVEYFTTPSLKSLSDSTNTVANCAGQSGSVTFALCYAATIGNSITTPGRYYTRVRFGPNAGLSTQFPSSKAATKLRMNGMQIIKPSGFFFADDAVYDFYGQGLTGVVTVANKDVVQLTGAVSKFLFNSYVISSGALSNVHVGLSNFWTGSSSGNLDGTAFPAYIRILGYFAGSEMANMKRLAIFFDGLDFFTNPDGTVPCATNVEQLTCYGAAGQRAPGYNPTVLSRIIIDTTLLQQGTSNVNRLQIVIPVKTIATYNTIDIGVATLTDQTFYFTDKNYFKTTYFRTSTRVDYTSLVNNPTSFSSNQDTNLKMTLPAGAKIGSVTNVYITNSENIVQNDNPDSSLTPNIYASMSYCAVWNWNTDDSFSITPIPNLVTSIYTCPSLSYYDANGIQHWCTYCPIESTITATGTTAQTANYVTLPYQQGPDIPGAYLTFSTNNGALKYYGQDVRTSALQVPFTFTAYPLIANPPILYKGFKNYEITIYFLSAVNIPANGYVSIVPSGSSSFGFQAISSAIALFDNTTCVLAFSQSSFNCSLSGTEDFAAGPHNFTIKGIDMLTTSGSYNFLIFSLTSAGKQVETNNINDPGKYTIVDPSPGYQLAVQNLTFYNADVGAQTWFTFDFRPDKVTTFANEQFVFNLGSSFISTQGSRTILCYVKEGSSLSYKFKSCTTSDLTQLTLTPTAEYWRNDGVNYGFMTVVLAIIQVPTSITTAISGSLVRGSPSATVQALGNVSSYPAVITASGISGSNLALTKTYGRAGSISEISLIYTPSIDLTNPDSIYMTFPLYYEPGLGYDNMYCTIDGEPVFCNATADRTLRIQYFTRTYPGNTAHTIKIYGVKSPSTAAAASIFVALDNDDNLANFVEQGSVSDSIPSSSGLQTLTVYGITVSSTEFRTNQVYTITILAGSAVSSGNILAIDFPDAYGNYLMVAEYQPTCALASSTGTIISSTCTFFGSRIKIPINSALTANTPYVITLVGVRNPDDALGKTNKLVVSIVDSTEANVLYRSISSFTNSKFITYTANPNYDTLQWALGSTTLSSTTPVLLEQGVYSDDICLTVGGLKFKKSFNVSLDPVDGTKFNINPSPTRVSTGLAEVCLQIASVAATPATYYDIKFTKDETVPWNFTSLPRLRVHLLAKTVTIQMPYTSYNIPSGGVSLPILVDLSSYPPSGTVIITAALSNTRSFSFFDVSTSTLNANYPTGYFVIKATRVASVGDIGTLTLTISSASTSNNYVLGNSTITLNIITSPTTTFAPYIAATSIKQATLQQFAISGNIPAVIYWGNALANTLERPCDYIKDKALTFQLFNHLDYAQEQFGFALLYDTQLSTVFNISNLRSNQDYTLTYCWQPLNSYTYTQSSLAFSSFDNNVIVVSGTFTLLYALTTQQEIDFACFLASQFRLLEYNVISENGNSCMDKYITTAYPPVYTEPASIYQPTPVDTSSLQYTPSRLLFTEALEPQPQPQPCETSSTIPSMTIQPRRLDSTTSTTTTTGNITITYIFYGNAEIDTTDAIDSTIQQKMAALDTTSITTDYSLLSNLQIFINGYTGAPFPSVTLGVYNGLINSIAPAFGTYPGITMTKGTNWIAMQGVTLQSSGHVYAVAVLTGSGTPNTIQIRHGLDSLNIAAPSSQATYESTTVSLNITGLTTSTNGTQYDIYYYATNDDISRFAITTSIAKLSSRTVPVQKLDISANIVRVSWALLAVLVAIVLGN